MIRILLVDDQTLICEVLKIRLEAESDFQVVGQAKNGHIAIEQVEALHPDIVLIDIEMPGIDGLSATQIIRDRFPETEVIILSMHNDKTYLDKALQAGAKGYLIKDCHVEELASAIRSVNNGYSQFAPGLLEKMI
ncbi:MAG: response regulator transcription factor, partial [Moorea sp. SIO2B7]|nr:response regulator transcription factor [Moorena sp. SIO2B7]